MSKQLEQFTPAELCAIAGAVKEARLNTAKAALPDGFSCRIALTVRISALVQKGATTAATSYEAPAVVDMGAPHVFAALRKLGIGPKRFADALAKVSLDVEFDEELAAVVRAENEKRAKDLPAIKGTTPGRAGAVTSKVDFERLPDPPAPEPATLPIPTRPRRKAA